MKCYGLGALELFDGIYDIDTVSMTIYQPRRQNISTFEISKDDLYRWADEVLKPTAAHQGKWPAHPKPALPCAGQVGAVQTL